MHMTKTRKAVEYIKIFLIIILVFAILSLIGKDILIGIKKSYSVIDERENSIQITCVGNSNLYSAFSPLDLWNKYGYASTVCASARQTIEESRHIMKKHFEKQSPKLVIIETDMLFEHRPKKQNFCKKSNCIKDFLRRINPAFLKEDIENVFSTLKNNKFTHGYRYSSKVCAIRCGNYMSKTDSSEEISAQSTEQMDRLIMLCRENNAKILFVEIPSVSSWNYERHNAAKKFARERNIDFVDFNLLYNELKLSPTQCYRDKGCHLNYDGAKAVTEYIGNYIKNSIPLKNLKSDTDYENWNEAYLKFVNYKLRSQTSLFKQLLL